MSSLRVTCRSPDPGSRQLLMCPLSVPARPDAHPVLSAVVLSAPGGLPLRQRLTSWPDATDEALINTVGGGRADRDSRTVCGKSVALEMAFLCGCLTNLTTGYTVTYASRFLGCECEDGRLLGCSAVQTGVSLSMFRRSLLPPSSGWWVLGSSHQGLWVEHVAGTGEIRNAYKILVAKPKQNGPLGKPRRRREDNIKIYLKDIEYRIVDLVTMAFLCERSDQSSGTKRRIFCLDEQLSAVRKDSTAWSCRDVEENAWELV
jgi:hypothetical protein